MDKDFLESAGNALADMRLLIEGALVLYEVDALPICRLLRDNAMPVPLTAWDTIGNALYELRTTIGELQREHTEAILQTA